MLLEHVDGKMPDSHHQETTCTPFGTTLAARPLADDPDTKPRHFGDVTLTGKLLSPNVYFKIEMEN
jgi:hypothetical protein